MSISITIAGVDMSSYLTGTLTIEAEEGRAVIASFAVCDAGALLDSGSVIGGAVIISYSGTLLFSGKIRTADFDPFTRVFDIQASDIREDAKDYSRSWLDGSVFQVDLAGTLEFSTSDKTKVYGTGTAFTTELRPGQRIFNATDDDFGNPWTGTATADGETILYDSAASWVADSLVGKYVYNTTVAAIGKITSNTETEAHFSTITGSGFTSGDGYRISPGFDGAVSVKSIESDTELTLEFEYPGTCGTGKAGKRLYGLYFAPINGEATDTFDMAIKALDCEWAVLEVDKTGAFRVSDCQAKTTADVTFDSDNFLFHSVKMKVHDASQVKNCVTFDIIEDYQLRWKYRVVNEAGAIDETADSILSQLRSSSQVGNWRLAQPLYSSQLGSGPPYTFDIYHYAEWEQQKRNLSLFNGHKCTDSIEKYGLKVSKRRVMLDYSLVPGSYTWSFYDNSVSGVSSFLNQCVNNKARKPEFFTIQNILAGMARSEIMESHRLVTVSLQLAIYVDASRTLTVQGDFPNLQFRGKTVKYSHEYQAETGRAVTSMDIAVIPSLV